MATAQGTEIVLWMNMVSLNVPAMKDLKEICVKVCVYVCSCDECTMYNIMCVDL